MTIMNVDKHFLNKDKGREAGKCEITIVELFDIPISSQPFLRALKDKGAPVLGVCVLQLDGHYTWMTDKDNAYMSTHVKWVPKS